ncbi:MAG: DUF1588 domain-containing protein, partial [Nannocystaceae bacterium]|nr:DUF1588 domain-containing protein [Nannocystaceae bacterium]
MLTWSRWICVVVLASGCGSGARAPSVGGDTDTDGSGATAEGDGDDGTDDGHDGTDDGVDVDPNAVAEPLARRLTDTQYVWSVLDVLGATLTEDERDALPPDIPTGRDYSTNTDVQSFSSQYVLAYAEIARSLTARLDTQTLVAEHGGCDAVTSACRVTFIKTLGHRLYRRPLTETELARYLDLAETIASRAETTEDDVVHGLVQALLQAPQFLYRLEYETEGEVGQVRRVDGYELASRLSYFLWQSAPDDALLTFAAGPNGDGEFDPAALGEQIERMVGDDRFGRSRALFWDDYTVASRSSYGTADAALAAELRDSLMATVLRISGVDAQPEPLSALFDGQQLVMTPAVAQLAGAKPTGPGLQVYETADTEQRLGVVTHPAFIASIGTSSFVGRGLFLTERLLCQRVAEPPGDVAEEIEQTAQATEGMTPREASEFRFGLEPVCLGCHTQFEPIAYAFERYDMAGRYVTTDESGRPLYSDGVLPTFIDRPEIAFADAPELLSALANVDAVPACLVENMTEFGTGSRALAVGEFLPHATAEFVDDGLTYDALARAVASSEQLTLLR